MRARHVAGALGVGALGLVLTALPAGASPAGVVPHAARDAVADLGTQSNLLWVVLGAVLVIFMQAGFALVETGFCRAKHAAHVVSTNFAIFGLGFVGYYLVGYSLMFGGYSTDLLPGYGHALGHSLVGHGNWVFLWGGGWALSAKGAATAGVMAYFLYMVAFMDTTATIPTGAMAERWKWKAFVGWGLFCGALYYPLFGAWTWGGGWLASLGKSLHLGYGYVDFAGSGVVHAMGGAAALAGALVLGPRIGKYGKDGKARTLAGHHIPMAMLGTFILLFGWFGFNAASTLAITDVQFAVVATNTALAAAFGATAAMFYLMFKGEKPDPGMMANGMLAGLVAITAPCAFVDPWAAALIGTLAGVLVVVSCRFVEHRLKIDDPVGAISVHGVCGAFGVLSIGLLGNGRYGEGWNGTTAFGGSRTGVTGILYGAHGWGQLGAQAAGVAVIVTVMAGIAYMFFRAQSALMTGGIRSEEADELLGLDMPEMGTYGYPEFVRSTAPVISYPHPDDEELDHTLADGPIRTNGVPVAGGNGDRTTRV